MFSKVVSMGIIGMEAYTVGVEADLSRGLPQFAIVGLPSASVSEAKDRVRSAMKNAGFDFPVSRITVNLAPADVRKEGSVYDLPVLIALLLASEQIRIDEIEKKAFIGELSLGGEIRGVHGALPMAAHAAQCGISQLFIPAKNAAECAVVEGIEIFPAESLSQLIAHFSGEAPIKPIKREDFQDFKDDGEMPDFADVKGQFAAKRALEVAAAGGHNVCMVGPPGSGKSMLAKRLPSILPEMTYSEAIETTKIYSVAGLLPENRALIKSRPFRAPHHTVSPAGLSGGGSVPRPGEISLAHNGVIFLDELPEFPRTTMEALRQPLEDGTITISRVAGTLTYPCSVMLVCAMNPCPCGYFGYTQRKCTCPAGVPEKYLARVSGPLLDRIDIHIEVPPVDFNQLSDKLPCESSAQIRARVNKARQIQQKRFDGSSITCNARMNPSQTREYCTMTAEAVELLKNAFDKMNLSARAYDKILRLARTIADLDSSEKIEVRHVSEAVQYRSLDRKFRR